MKWTMEIVDYVVIVTDHHASTIAVDFKQSLEKLTETYRATIELVATSNCQDTLTSDIL